MDLKGFVYALALRTDAGEQRALGAEFLKQAIAHGDAELMVGWLVSDWMDMVRRHENLDRLQNDPLDSRTPGRWRAVQ